MTTPTILLATWGDGLFALTGDGCVQEISGESVRGLTADGRGGALAIIGPHSLSRRVSGGQWETVATSELELSCCMAVNDTVSVGTDDARMLRLSEAGELQLLDGFDRVAGRDSWFAGSAIVNGQRVGPPLGVRSVAANSDRRVLFANVHVGGIPRSLDDGRTWEPTIEIKSDVHEVCAHPKDPDIVAAAAGAGLCISRDAGKTWAIEREGLYATHCSAVAFAGDDILFSASTDPFAPQGRIYRRAIQPDAAIVAVEGGMPAWTGGSADTGCIAVSGPLVAIVDRAGNLYRSDDFGQTWMCRSTGLQSPSGVLIC